MYLGLRLVIYFKNFILARLNIYIGLRLVDLNNYLDIAKMIVV